MLNITPSSIHAILLPSALGLCPLLTVLPIHIIVLVVLVLVLVRLRVGVDIVLGARGMSGGAVGATINPWSRPIERCEEEDETPDPLAFGEDILHFMETSVEDSRKEYFELLQKHVSEEMKSAVPEVMDLLSSPNALNCFAPSSWNGIKIKPVELITKGNLPDRMNVSARSIRPALLHHAGKEFERLGKYFLRDGSSQE